MKSQGLRLYDVHYHLFDLSHPNLRAFLLRDDLINSNAVSKIIDKLPFPVRLMPFWFMKLFSGRVAKEIKKFIKDDSDRILNLLSMMEGAIEYHFLLVEYYLLNKETGKVKSLLNDISKLVICPLIIDFGYKGMEKPDWFYNFPPAKPVVNQVIDILNASYFYYNYDLILHPDKPEKFKLIPSNQSKEEKFFEIYPFLGINTVNYSLEEIAELFDKYFRGYEYDILPGERQAKLYSKMGTAKVDLEDMIFRRKEKQDNDFYSYLFAGIKLYPPLGFDPWPSHNARELEKVRFLYSECIRKKIPLTVHCSDGGFITSPDSDALTDPANKWEKVLSQVQFKNLKLNFAHLGNQKDGKSDWQQAILSAIEGNRNIYTDCSCITSNVDDYVTVSRIINPGNERNILFGTDFIINLIWSESYNQYLDNFLRTTHLNHYQKGLMGEKNPEKFLFG
ncbi:MAG TPA: amidohydrolase family protein [Bacteroidales bacterium]|nr:amidohydrolase family protein [Bacteroidales bacterium]